MLEKMRTNNSGNEMTGMLMKQNQRIPLERLLPRLILNNKRKLKYATVGGDPTITMTDWTQNNDSNGKGRDTINPKQVAQETLHLQQTVEQ